jgi:phage shock protein PspC (stress-responsive transcriptional regulator)
VNRLYRHPTDKVIGGVAAGVAAWMNVDPTIVRIAWVLLALFTGGIFLLLYIVMLFVVPLAPPGWPPGPGPDARRYPGDPVSGGWGDPVPPTPGAAPSTPGWHAATTASPSSPPGWAPPSVGGNGNAGIVAGVVLILLGAWFLVDQYIDIDWSLLWPVFVMLAGVVLIVLATRRGSRAR